MMFEEGKDVYKSLFCVNMAHINPMGHTHRQTVRYTGLITLAIEICELSVSFNHLAVTSVIMGPYLPQYLDFFDCTKHY